MDLKEKSEGKYEFHTAKVMLSSRFADVWPRKKDDVWSVNEGRLRSATNVRFGE